MPSVVSQPLAVPKRMSALKTLEALRQHPVRFEVAEMEGNRVARIGVSRVAP